MYAISSETPHVAGHSAYSPSGNEDEDSLARIRRALQGYRHAHTLDCFFGRGLYWLAGCTVAGPQSSTCSRTRPWEPHPALAQPSPYVVVHQQAV
jgi:hypothetical protein